MRDEIEQRPVLTPRALRALVALDAIGAAGGNEARVVVTAGAEVGDDSWWGALRTLVTCRFADWFPSMRLYRITPAGRALLQQFALCELQGSCHDCGEYHTTPGTDACPCRHSAGA